MVNFVRYFYHNFLSECIGFLYFCKKNLSIQWEDEDKPSNSNDLWILEWSVMLVSFFMCSCIFWFLHSNHILVLQSGKFFIVLNPKRKEGRKRKKDLKESGPRDTPSCLVFFLYLFTATVSAFLFLFSPGGVADSPQGSYLGPFASCDSLPIFFLQTK